MWQLVKDKIYNNKKDKLAEHVKELINELDLSDGNLELVNDMTKNCKDKLLPKYFNTLCPTTSIFAFLIKDILEYSGIIITKSTSLPLIYKRLENKLKNYQDKDEKLNKMKDILKKE